MDEIEISTHAARPVPTAGVLRLYTLEAWWPERNADALETVLAGGPAVGAWDGDRLVGFARAVTDGRFRAYVEDVVVDPAYRRRRIGPRLVTALLEELAPVQSVSLFCARELVSMYEELGFARTSQAVLHRRG